MTSNANTVVPVEGCWPREKGEAETNCFRMGDALRLVLILLFSVFRPFKRGELNDVFLGAALGRTGCTSTTNTNADGSTSRYRDSCVRDFHMPIVSPESSWRTGCGRCSTSLLPLPDVPDLLPSVWAASRGELLNPCVSVIHVIRGIQARIRAPGEHTYQPQETTAVGRTWNLEKKCASFDKT